MNTDVLLSVVENFACRLPHQVIDSVVAEEEVELLAELSLLFEGVVFLHESGVPDDFSDAGDGQVLNFFFEGLFIIFDDDAVFAEVGFAVDRNREFSM